MKILITTFTYPPNSDGCAEAAAVKARGLVRLGHDVTVATAFHPDRKSSPVEANPRVVQFNISGSANWRLGINGETAKYQGFLRNFSCDLILFENWDMWPTYLAEPLLKKLPAKKILASQGYASQIWIPNPKFPWGLGVWLGGWPLILRTPLLMQRIDHFVFTSAKTNFGRFLDHRLARVLAPRRYSIIPNGAFAGEFNDDQLPDFRAKFGIGSELLFLCVANYSSRKNQLMAVRAFRRAQLPNATMVFIGSELNDYSEAAQRLDSELQLKFPAGQVVFLEKLSRIQTCAAYKAANLFVLPAKAETQPIVLLEAMASHTPWISTDTGCVSELPGGVVVRSEDEMAEKMKKLAGSSQLRQKLADEGWAACQQTYDWERVVAAYDQLVKQLMPKGLSV